MIAAHLLPRSIPIIIQDQTEEEFVLEIVAYEQVGVLGLGVLFPDLIRKFRQHYVVVHALLACFVDVSLGVFQVFFNVLLLGAILEFYSPRTIPCQFYELMQFDQFLDEHLEILFYFSSEQISYQLHYFLVYFTCFLEAFLQLDQLRHLLDLLIEARFQDVGILDQLVRFEELVYSVERNHFFVRIYVLVEILATFLGLLQVALSYLIACLSLGFKHPVQELASLFAHRGVESEAGDTRHVI